MVHYAERVYRQARLETARTLTMVENKLERVSIFVDVQNVYYTCRQVFQRNFDYNKFWKKVGRNRQVVSAIAYATDQGDQKQMQFQNILRAIGFEVKLRPVLRRSDGTSKADWDVGIALDVYEAASKCDSVVLVSGDGDFDVLLRRIKDRFDSHTEVYGVHKLTSDLLIKEADEFTPINSTLLL